MALTAGPANAAVTPVTADSQADNGALVKPTTTYVVDARTGAILEQYPTRSGVSTMAVSPVGPGCTSTSLCLRAGSVPYYGYQGTGTLSVNVPNRTNYFTGAYTTRLQWTNPDTGSTVTGRVVGPGATVYFNATVTVSQVRLS